MSAPTMKSLEGRIELLGTALDVANELILALQQQINAHMDAINAQAERIAVLEAAKQAPAQRTAPPQQRTEWEIISKYPKHDGTLWLKVFRAPGRTSDYQVTEAAYNAWTRGLTGVGLTQSMMAVKRAA